jgi:hypothetical protein
MRPTRLLWTGSLRLTQAARQTQCCSPDAQTASATRVESCTLDQTESVVGLLVLSTVHRLESATAQPWVMPMVLQMVRLLVPPLDPLTVHRLESATAQPWVMQMEQQRVRLLVTPSAPLKVHRLVIATAQPWVMPTEHPMAQP